MKKILVILSVLAIAVYFIFFNISFDKSTLKNNTGEVKIIGHAGLGFKSFIPFNSKPSNSFASISAAVKDYSANGVEVDVQMSKDGRFLLYHDDQLERNTGFSGCISEYNYMELTNVNYEVGAPFDWLQSEQLVGLDSIIRYFKTLEEFPEIHLDIRTKSACKNAEQNALWEQHLAQNLLHFLDEHQVQTEKILIVSLSKEFISYLKEKGCKYPIAFEVVGAIEDGLNFMQENSIKTVVIKPKLLTKELSARFHEKEYTVITFGAKSKSGNKKLLELNPDVIQTNNISALKELLEE